MKESVTEDTANSGPWSTGARPRAQPASSPVISNSISLVISGVVCRVSIAGASLSANDDQRFLGGFQHGCCGTAHQKLTNPGVTIGAHDQDIDAMLLLIALQGGFHIPGPYRQGNINAQLRQH